MIAMPVPQTPPEEIANDDEGGYTDLEKDDAIP